MSAELDDDPIESQQALDGIQTPWSLILKAHGAGGESDVSVRRFLAVRYHAAVHRYITSVVWNPEDAAEVAQRVMVRLLEGRFDRAEPGRGRFRDYLKAAVRNEVLMLVRARRRRPDRAELEESSHPAVMDEIARDLDRQWLDDCRRSLLNSALQELEGLECRRPLSPFFTALRLRREFPEDDSETFATRLSAAVGRPIPPGTARQQLRRARLTLAQTLIDHVTRTLQSPTPEDIEQELIDLGLMEFVRRYLDGDGQIMPR